MSIHPKRINLEHLGMSYLGSIVWLQTSLTFTQTTLEG